jgi:hypothetical protein
MVVGILWQYEWKEVHNGRKKNYEFLNGGKKFEFLRMKEEEGEITIIDVIPSLSI